MPEGDEQPVQTDQPAALPEESQTPPPDTESDDFWSIPPTEGEQSERGPTPASGDQQSSETR
jgi:hypothetical protein